MTIPHWVVRAETEKDSLWWDVEGRGLNGLWADKIKWQDGRQQYFTFFSILSLNYDEGIFKEGSLS